MVIKKKKKKRMFILLNEIPIDIAFGSISTSGMIAPIFSIYMQNCIW